jgi:hypothetical protein
MRVLEPQTAAPGSFGEGLHAAVVLVAATVEDACFDSGGTRAVGDQLAHAFRLLHRSERAKLRLGPVRGHDRVSALIIDQLGKQAAVGSVDRESRALGTSSHLAADTRAAPLPPPRLLQYRRAHALLPTFRATCSPA